MSQPKDLVKSLVETLLFPNCSCSQDRQCQCQRRQHKGASASQREAHRANSSSNTELPIDCSLQWHTLPPVTASNFGNSRQYADLGPAACPGYLLAHTLASTSGVQRAAEPQHQAPTDLVEEGLHCQGDALVRLLLFCGGHMVYCLQPSPAPCQPVCPGPQLHNLSRATTTQKLLVMRRQPYSIVCMPRTGCPDTDASQTLPAAVHRTSVRMGDRV